MEVKRDIVCNQQQQGWFSRLWGTRGQRKLGEFIEHRTQKEIFGFRRNQIGHEIEGQTRRTKHLFRCHNVSSPKTNLERDHRFACSVRGVFWGVVVGLRPAPGCICKRRNWNICFLNSGSETTCHDLGWLNTFHNLSNFIVSVVRAYFNINLIGSLLAFSHACFGTANLFYGRASLVEVCFCKIFVHINSKSGIEVSLKPGQTHTHRQLFIKSKQVTQLSRISVRFCSRHCQRWVLQFGTSGCSGATSYTAARGVGWRTFLPASVHSSHVLLLKRGEGKRETILKMHLQMTVDKSLMLDDWVPGSEQQRAAESLATHAESRRPVLQFQRLAFRT